ncbi:trehalose-6-P hydrolase [Gammaproteobacteria bacterium]|nr:trehalose-6-P hydrolase [Gammaproteobacteria bacterium]
MNKSPWWKNAVAYQIYPRSFYDSNQDGIGDLKGITQKLDYLHELGIDIIWICPMYQSPNDDNGYDISNYQAIMTEFGTMADFDELLNECHKRNIKLIIDLVINHTSDEHAWFIESRSSTTNPKRDWYIWQDGKQTATHKTHKEPNNWESIFQGSAWKYDRLTKQWFMHVFSERQPDLNWENKEVRTALYAMINWWLAKGIDGFRVDAISHIKKKTRIDKNIHKNTGKITYPDLPNPKKLAYVPSYAYHMNVTGIDAYLTELRDQTFKKYDIMTVGEANGVSTQQAPFWVNEKDGIFNMIFQFEHLSLWQSETKKEVDLPKLKRVLSKWQNTLEGVGWNALYIENHDQPRAVSTWGDDKKHWYASATCLATMYFLMKGTPFIYQGQEIGMCNAVFAHIDEYQDISSRNLYHKKRSEGLSDAQALAILADCSREHARTPMQWNNAENAGFSEHKPWLKVNSNYKNINVKIQKDAAHSIYAFYKKLINLRKINPILLDGVYKLLCQKHLQIFAYTRTLKDQTIVIVCNLSAHECDLSRLKLPKIKELLLSNMHDIAKLEPTHNQIKTLAAYNAYVYLSV